MASSRGLSCLHRRLISEAPGARHRGGPLIVLAHAAGLCKETWVPAIDEMAKLDIGVTVDVVAFDFTGHGDSPSPKQRSIAAGHWQEYCPLDVCELLHYNCTYIYPSFLSDFSFFLFLFACAREKRFLMYTLSSKFSSSVCSLIY